MNKQRLVEGIVDKVLKAIIKGKAKKIEKNFSKSPSVLRAFKELVSAERNFKKTLSNYEKKREKTKSRDLHFKY